MNHYAAIRNMSRLVANAILTLQDSLRNAPDVGDLYDDILAQIDSLKEIKGALDAQAEQD